MNERVGERANKDEPKPMHRCSPGTKSVWAAILQRLNLSLISFESADACAYSRGYTQCDSPKLEIGLMEDYGFIDFLHKNSGDTTAPCILVRRVSAPGVCVLSKTAPSARGIGRFAQFWVVSVYSTFSARQSLNLLGNSSVARRKYNWAGRRVDGLLGDNRFVNMENLVEKM